MLSVLSFAPFVPMNGLRIFVAWYRLEELPPSQFLNRLEPAVVVPVDQLKDVGRLKFVTA